MKVLVIGSGGREHALAWKMAQSPEAHKVYSIPGNVGMGEIGACVELDITHHQELINFAKEKEIALTVVGPEAPLAGGVVNDFEAAGLKIFGPKKEAAGIEASKIFAKRLMQKYGIPTGQAEIFGDYYKAKEYVKSCEPPLVVKADGLAAGKGVAVCFDTQAALEALENCFIKKKFGESGEKVLVEEYLEGEELSLLCFTDGKMVLPMVPAQDYKRVFDGDKGPNTGGMGSYSPVPIVTKEIYDQVVKQILEPAIFGLAQEGREYRGVLYGGLILTKEGPKVLEFNVRFGDPESQAMLPRLESDLVEVMLKVAEGKLDDTKLDWREEKCVTVALASQGYPESYETGFEIKGLEEARRGSQVEIFHAGTASNQGKVLTAGGRVLNVSALGRTFEKARTRAYATIDKIHFEGMHYRKDIALKAVAKGEGRGTKNDIQRSLEGEEKWLNL